MNCPLETAEILLEILTAGLLRARVAGWNGNAALAALEADHLHNLPGLLCGFSLDRLRYYCEVEVPNYIARCREMNIHTREFEPHWERLRVFLESAKS